MLASIESRQLDPWVDGCKRRRSTTFGSCCLSPSFFCRHRRLVVVVVADESFQLACVVAFAFVVNEIDAFATVGVVDEGTVAMDRHHCIAAAAAAECLWILAD